MRDFLTRTFGLGLDDMAELKLGVIRQVAALLGLAPSTYAALLAMPTAMVARA